jgi:hypothetical protein
LGRAGGTTAGAKDAAEGTRRKPRDPVNREEEDGFTATKKNATPHPPTPPPTPTATRGQHKGYVRRTRM